MPSLELLNRQRSKRIDTRCFRGFAELAIAKVVERFGRDSLPEEIVVVLVSDALISRIHRDFMALDGPTDVITFRHGEIFISVDTAERQAEKFLSELDRELRLYFVHGLLHLAGLDDLTQQGFAEMVSVQEAMVQQVEELLDGTRPCA